MKSKFIIILLVLLIVTAVLLPVFYKKARIIFPEIYGLTCINDYLCIDDPDKKDKSIQLYNYSFYAVSKKLGKFNSPPKVIFCSSRACSQKFGLDKSSAFNVGTFGIVISDRGWVKHLVTHEFIHYWQSETIGNLSMLNNKDWLTEGMAYSMSDDPRLKLSPPFQFYRNKFNNWLRTQSSKSIKQAFIDEST